MSQLFISHVEEDKAIAVAIAEAMERRGFGVWFYERENEPGPSYLKRVAEAIKRCEVVILIVSEGSMGSDDVDAEVSAAFRAGKRFVPVLNGVSHDELESRRLEWVFALRAATAVSLPPAGVTTILDLLEKGIRGLGLKPTLTPAPSAEPAEADEAPRPAELDEVECTVFGSRSHVPGDSSLFQVWLHTAEQFPEVERRAKAADPLALPLAGEVIPSAPARGERLRLGLKAGRFPVEPAEAELTWEGGPDSLDFVVAVPDNRPSAQFGRATLFRGDALVASLAFQVSVKDEDEEEPPRLPRQTLRAYICYANQDRAEVLKRAQMLSSSGVSVFMDVHDLRPSEDWEEQIRRRIDEADSFFLFWSDAARQSEQVIKEVKYALARQGGDHDRPPRIIPVVLSVPVPPPPPGLEELHFQDTWSYLIAAESARNP